MILGIMVICVDVDINLSVVDINLYSDIISLVLTLLVVPFVEYCLISILAVSHRVLEFDDPVFILGSCDLERAGFFAIHSDSVSLIH